MSYSIQYKNDCLAASDIFRMFTESFKFYTFCYHLFKEYRCLKNVNNQIDTKNEWLVLSANFTAKFGFGFCINTGKNFFIAVSF